VIVSAGPVSPAQTRRTVEDEIVSSRLPGLSHREATARLKAEGYNELPRAGRRSILRVAVDIVREPMFGLLLAAGIIYLALGDLAEALILLVFATISVTIAIVQESRSEHVLEALRDLTSPRALVIRGDEAQRIPGRDVVRGDILVLAEGDRVAADAIVRTSHDLQADESLLTGESVPVRKRATSESLPAASPGGDDLPFVFAGSLIVRGRGIAEVRATGPGSEIGRIGQALAGIDSEPTRLSRQIGWLVRTVAAIGLAISLVATMLYGLLRGSWLDGLLGGIALGMSMLPEEFPLVLTVFMVMGAWRISRVRVLTRRAAAIETLGAATVLCTDKTGTLTQNRMTINALRIAEATVSPTEDTVLPEKFATLVEFGVLASAKDPFDPMDKAFHELAATHLAVSRRDEARTLAREYGLRPELLAVTQAWHTADHNNYAVAAKGAPEAIAALCRLDAVAVAVMQRTVEDMAQSGMRVLGVASALYTGPELPESPRDFVFTFLGLVGFSDPLRETVPDAMRRCRSAGIRVVMITGDYPATARAIARQAGLDPSDLVTGGELDLLSDAQLGERIQRTTVFARIMPKQKLRIVTALKSSGAVVAMTGDGVNDAPSLKAADIGIAMGERGTDVAREAASIVLLDDDFGSIVETIRLGRRIYDNLRKAMGYILAVHVPIAGISLLPLLFGLPLILGPMHIAFLEMVIDPMCSVVFEAEGEEDDIMQRPPRDPNSPLLSRALIGWSVLQGVFAFLLVALIYIVALRRGMPEAEVRALTFVSLVLVNISLSLVNRSFGASLVAALCRPNPTLWWMLGAAATLLAIVLTWLPARALFHFGPLHADDLAVCSAAAIVVLVLLDLLKALWRVRLAS
jgi:Ca2+-transporting ATPase